MIDIGTIGPRPCEIVLNKILIEHNDRKMINKVMSVFHEFRQGLKHLKDIKDVTFRKRMLSTWRKQCYQRIDDLNLPKVVYSHLRCVLSAHWRDFNHEKQETVIQEVDESFWLNK